MGFTSRLGLTVLAASAATAIASCRGATEILLDIRTNIPCSGAAKWHGIAVYTGHPGIDVETRAPTTTSTACGADGQIGTLAVVPNAANDAEIGLRIVAGITRAPEDCAAHGYEGCVVARRTLTFLPHETLPLTINLDSECTGLGCDALHSCTNGSCTDSRVTPTAQMPDAGPSITGPVRCGDDGVTCPTEGNTCCLTVDQAAGATHGECKPGKECPSTNIVLQCDSNAQCPGADENGSPNVCCLVYTVLVLDAGEHPLDHISSSACIPYTGCLGGNNPYVDGYLVCDDRQTCLGKFTCQESSDHLPGYFWCHVD